MTEPTREPDGSGVLAPDAGERPAADVPRLLGQVPVTSRARSQMTDEEKSEIDAAIAELWREFKASDDQRLRERLILHYSPLVKYVAGRVGVGLPPNIEQADLVSYGIFGLIDAIEKFDLEPGHQVRDVRDQPHQGRDHRRAARDRLDPALGALQGPRGREGLRRARGASCTARPPRPRSPPSSASGSRTCTRSSARSRFVNVVALDELLNVGGERGDKLTLVDTLEDTKAEDPVQAFETEETKYLLARAINTLPEREKIVVTLYYYEGLTLAEIGQVLGRHREPHLPDAHQGRPAAARQARRPARLSSRSGAPFSERCTRPSTAVCAIGRVRPHVGRGIAAR